MFGRPLPCFKFSQAAEGILFVAQLLHDGEPIRLSREIEIPLHPVPLHAQDICRSEVSCDIPLDSKNTTRTLDRFRIHRCNCQLRREQQARLELSQKEKKLG